MFYALLMQSISVGELNQHLDEVMARVEEGQHVSITRDGKTIATIKPTDIESDNTGLEFVLDDRYRRGR